MCCIQAEEHPVCCSQQSKISLQSCCRGSWVARAVSEMGIAWCWAIDSAVYRYIEFCRGWIYRRVTARVRTRKSRREKHRRARPGTAKEAKVLSFVGVFSPLLSARFFLFLPSFHRPSISPRGSPVLSFLLVQRLDARRLADRVETDSRSAW